MFTASRFFHCLETEPWYSSHVLIAKLGYAPGVGLFRFLFLQRRTFFDAVVSSLSDSCHGGSSDSDSCFLVEEITSLFKSRIMILFDHFCQGEQWFFLELAWGSSTLRLRINVSCFSSLFKQFFNKAFGYTKTLP